MKRHDALKIVILAPPAVLIGIGFVIIGNQLSNYLIFLDGLSGPDATDCSGERCLCSNLMCVTEARYIPEMLETIAIGMMFVAGGSFWVVLFSKRAYLRTHGVL